MATQSQKNKKKILLEQVVKMYLAANEVKQSNLSRDQAKRYIWQFYNDAPSDDIAIWDVHELTGVAGSMWNLAQKRKAGQAKINIFTPTSKKHTWESARTVIEIISDDMPFVLDSIAAELNFRNLVIESLLHPIIHVKRDKTGALIGVCEDEKGATRSESHIHIQLEQVISNDLASELQSCFERIMKDVRLATSDWKNMLLRLQDTISDLQSLSAKVTAEDREEAIAFLQYMHDNNFTLLGARDYRFTNGSSQKKQFKVVENSGFGVLRNKDIRIFDQLAHDVKAGDQAKSLLVVDKLIDHYATVHRRVAMDAVSVKLLDKRGKVIGKRVFVGLFTSMTYSRRTVEVPYIRQKVARIVEKAGFAKNSHDLKALEHILEKYPRDELFQISLKKLYEIVMGILRLQERQRLALFMRRDHYDRFVSCLTYIPRDLYSTDFRKAAQSIFCEELKGDSSTFYTTLDDSPYARVLFIIKTSPGKLPKYSESAIEARLTEVSRAWSERLSKALVTLHEKIKGQELSYRYALAFPKAYHEQGTVHGAVHDIHHLEKVVETADTQIDLYQLMKAGDNELRLKVYHESTPIPLSGVLPILENMGLQIDSELPYEIKPADCEKSVWIHDFSMRAERPEKIQIGGIKEKFEQALLRIWSGEVENDSLNGLILSAGLTWEQVGVLRTYSRFLRQARYPYSQDFISDTLMAYPHITQQFFHLFDVLHNPESQKGAKTRAAAIQQDIESCLEAVERSDHDKILRSFMTLIQNTLRTNYYQRDKDGKRKSAFSIKINSRNISDLPQPRPNKEIYVYSSRFEAVHLRGGDIARGGLRWSDRHEDFRTEILGLVKAQMVKNSVIVPDGAKGGFVVKQPPKEGGRKAYMEEGIACYQLFINSVLDLTDNVMNGKIKHPKDVVCRDGADPYLVVAADKGTATFSDIANAISQDHKFWLDDAFASGGSSGYDHKKMGITARGAWESVKRHFRELGADIQKDPFNVIGVGDMGGDVFGNGMLLSKAIRLVGAFNHLHIFCDPSPDPATSFKERQRLFRKRGGWDQYDPSLLSPGGKIYERSAKLLKLTPQIQKAFGLEKEQVTPSELIKAMLVSETDLLWFGGIGTYIKSSRENQSDADDRANDSLRVNARDVGAAVIGEGANLGVTQLGRIEFAERGGKVNTDFIDNSAGVDTSDHEVNIKILLSDVMNSGKLNRKDRDLLLKDMTKSVAAHVLNNNYQQTQAISLIEAVAPNLLRMHAQFIRDLEREGRLIRSIEKLPDDETIERMLNDHRGLTRPEISVLVSYAKILLSQSLLDSRVPEEDKANDWLMNYFPDALSKSYKKNIESHQLKREIIATMLANEVVNRMGAVFVKSRMDKMNKPACDVVRSYMVMTDSFGVSELWSAIESLDNKIPAIHQIECLLRVNELIKHTTTWLLRHSLKIYDLEAETERFKPRVEGLKKCLGSVVSDDLKKSMKQDFDTFVGQGIPDRLAQQLAELPVLTSACDIVRISEGCNKKIEPIAKVYFDVGGYFSFGWLRQQVGSIKIEDQWHARALEGMVEDLYACQADLAAHIIHNVSCDVSSKQDVVKLWVEENSRQVEQVTDLFEEMRKVSDIDISMITLAEQRLRHLLD